MGDYISREALKKAFDNADADVCESYSDGYCDWGFGRKNINDVIDGAPAADVAPVVHGRWDVVEGRRLDNAICSNCGRHFQAYYEGYSFCPNCGAKMVGGADDETG